MIRTPLILQDCWIRLWNIWKVFLNYIWKVKLSGPKGILFEYLTCVDVVIPLDSTWSWDNIWLLTHRAGNGDNVWCVCWSVCFKSPRLFAQFKWQLNDRFSARTRAICTCLFSVKDNKLERLPQQYASLGLAIIQRLGWATKELRAWRYKRRVAQSCSLVVYADSDVVPTVRCQQEGGSGSQHGCGMLCGERKNRSVCAHVYTVCVYTCLHVPLWSG